jgi:hypothetical protein
MRTRLDASIFALATLLVAGCTHSEPAESLAVSQSALGDPRLLDVEGVLTRVGPLAESSLYACLLNTLTQGIGLAQAQDDCATKLLEDDDKGFGGGLGDFGGASGEAFDPAKIVDACGNSGDPQTSQASSGQQSFGKWGYATWGEGNGLYGYVERDAKQMKEEAIRNAEAAAAEFYRLADAEAALLLEIKAAKEAGDDAEAARLEEQRKAVREEALEAANKKKKAEEDARADPNKRPPNTVRPAGEGSACSEIMAGARELLRECHRTAWKSQPCASLLAKMNGCPDPALIYVNPEEGYSCGAKADPEAVKNAWVANCEKYVKYGPGGENPCEPPVVEGSGRAIRTHTGGVCSDPEALVDPEQNACVGTLEVSTFGQASVQEIIFIGLDKIGGPIVVLPPPPLPGDPRDPRDPR